MTAVAEPAVRVELLGPVRVWRDGALVGPAGRLRRGLLAMLALRANHVVPINELVDGLWGVEPPASAVNLVQTYISAWRHALEPDRAARAASDRLRTVGASYQLCLSSDESDLLRFEAMAAEGARLLAGGASEDGVALLGRALANWRSQPLADLTAVPFVVRAVEDLLARRVQVLELWAHHCLEHEVGDLGLVAASLDEARTREPLREGLAELAMWARCRLGRPAEALVLFERTRRLLAEELGVDPGVRLRDMHARVLADAPSLRPPRTAWAADRPARDRAAFGPLRGPHDRAARGRQAAGRVPLGHVDRGRGVGQEPVGRAGRGGRPRIASPMALRSCPWPTCATSGSCRSRWLRPWGCRSALVRTR